MKTKTYYIANDKSEHPTEQSAEEHNKLLRKVRYIMQPLGYHKHTTDFANGGGYYQHDVAIVKKVKTSLVKLTVSRYPWMKKDHDMNALKNAHPSWYCRVIDGGCGPIEDAWHRLWCISTQGREYGQPYYSTHENEAKHKCLNEDVA